VVEALDLVHVSARVPGARAGVARGVQLDVFAKEGPHAREVRNRERQLHLDSFSQPCHRIIHIHTMKL